MTSHTREGACDLCGGGDSVQERPLIEGEPEQMLCFCCWKQMLKMLPEADSMKHLLDMPD